MITYIPWFQSALNFFMNGILTKTAGMCNVALYCKALFLRCLTLKHGTSLRS
jgi:hypothetical protein